MARSTRRRVGSALLLAATACLGCDDGTPPVSSSSEEAKVKGTVTVRGQLLEDGEIQFDPNNVRRKGVGLRTAKVAKGAYEVTTLVGGNVVSVQSKKYQRDLAVTGATKPFEAQSGENTFDVELP